MAYQTKRDPLFDSSMQEAIEKRGKELLGLALLVAGLGLAAMLYSYTPSDPSWLSASDAPVRNWLGLFGASISAPVIMVIGIGGWALSALAVIWGVAIVATAGNFMVAKWSTIIGTLICLGMGWAVLIGGRDLLALMSTPVVVLMVVGGVLYSAGTGFLLLSRMRFHNTIWHGFVVAGSTVFFVAVFLHAAQVA